MKGSVRFEFFFLFYSDLSAATNDIGENAAEEQAVEEEPPLTVDSSKPFNMKKFRDSLRKPDCIMGERWMCQWQRESN